MTIIVPMAGCGQRFIDAGYDRPKPLIGVSDVNGPRLMLAHVLQMFSPKDKYVFVCDDQHLASTNMRQEILKLVPKATVVGLAPHKMGPVFTVKTAYEHIDDNEPAIVSYCDGTMRFRRWHFEMHLFEGMLDGCLFTHTDFNPHTLSSTKMAFLKVDGKLVTEIKEKSSYTNNPFAEHASSGVYYFAKGSYVKQYFDKALEQGLQHNGEYYVTLVYNLMIKDGLRVGFYNTPYVAILGTPEEVKNFEAWSTIIRGHQVRNEEDLLRCYRYWQDYHTYEY